MPYMCICPSRRTDAPYRSTARVPHSELLRHHGAVEAHNSTNPDCAKSATSARAGACRPGRRDRRRGQGRSAAQTCDAADTGRGRRSGAHGAHTQIARGGSVASHARTFVTESISRGTHRRRGSRLQAASGCIPQTPKTSPTATLRPRSPHARCACAHACDTPYPAVYDPQTDSRASPTPRPMPISSSQIIP